MIGVRDLVLSARQANCDLIDARRQRKPDSLVGWYRSKRSLYIMRARLVAARAGRMKVARIQELTCPICTATSRGRQWHMLDKGYGLCGSAQCLTVASAHISRDEFIHRYGHKGFHFDLREGL